MEAAPHLSAGWITGNLELSLSSDASLRLHSGVGRRHFDATIEPFFAGLSIFAHTDGDWHWDFGVGGQSKTYRDFDGGAHGGILRTVLEPVFHVGYRYQPPEGGLFARFGLALVVPAPALNVGLGATF